MVEKHEKVWGSEEWIVNTPFYCGKFLFLQRGKRCSLQYHKKKDETFYVLKGRVLMEVGNEVKIMEKGSIQHITPLTKHRFNGLESSVIIEISTHHEDSDTYKIETNENVPEEVIRRYS